MAKRSKKSNRCGRCGLCDLARFSGWHDRIQEGLGESTDEGSPRMTVIQEIHDDVARRYPLGIAVRLNGVIEALAYPDELDPKDEDAICDLADLEQDEIESAKLNGTRALESCAFGVQFLKSKYGVEA